MRLSRSEIYTGMGFSNFYYYSFYLAYSYNLSFSEMCSTSSSLMGSYCFCSALRDAASLLVPSLITERSSFSSTSSRSSTTTPD